MTIQTFEAFGFAEPLARALTQCGYTTPTPIQVQALPPQLEGRDLLGMAETGSGKTATFVLPLLQKIAADAIQPGYKQVVALILAPTRELAIQIDQEVASLSRNMNIRRAVVLGGVSKGPQINALKRGVHVLVATPGRLLDHVNMRSCDLSGVQVLVIDEADRMFDMGFIRDIKKIVSLIPMKRRTALFSATMPTEIKKFAYDILQDPYRVDLSTKSMVVDRIDQKVMLVRTAGEAEPVAYDPRRSGLRTRHRLHADEARCRPCRRAFGNGRHQRLCLPRQQGPECPAACPERLYDGPRPRSRRDRHRGTRHRRFKHHPRGELRHAARRRKPTFTALAVRHVKAPAASRSRSAILQSARKSRRSNV